MLDTRKKYGILFELELTTLSNEEIQLLHEKLLDFPPMELFDLKQRIKKLKPNKSFGANLNVVLFL